MIGSIVANVLGQLAVFVPALSDDVPAAAKVVSLVFALIAAVGAYGLWNRRIWGRRTTIAATILNLVSSVPAVVAAPSGAIAVIGAVIVVMCIGLYASESRWPGGHR